MVCFPPVMDGSGQGAQPVSKAGGVRKDGDSISQPSAIVWRVPQTALRPA